MNDQKTTIPVSSGLLCHKHRSGIGIALWEFLWLIDRTTREWIDAGERWGIVLNGKPIEAEEIARDFGTHAQTVRRNLKNLEHHGYIRMTRVKGGMVIMVRNSIKWQWRQHGYKGLGKSGASTGNRTLPAGFRPSEVDWEAEAKRGL